MLGARASAAPAGWGPTPAKIGTSKAQHSSSRRAKTHPPTSCSPGPMPLLLYLRFGVYAPWSSGSGETMPCESRLLRRINRRNTTGDVCSWSTDERSCLMLEPAVGGHCKLKPTALVLTLGRGVVVPISSSIFTAFAGAAGAVAA